MADAIPSRPAAKTPKAPAVESKDTKPVIEYHGEGAEKIKFTVDPKAARIRVYANGCILTDY